MQPGFRGYIDTLRISDIVRYSGTNFSAPTSDLSADANTLLLYNFNEALGSATTADGSGNGHTGTLGTGFAGATSPEFTLDPAEILAGPIGNPANGHLYYLLNDDTWQNSEAKAVVLGGHLATIRNLAENDWIYSQFSQFGGTNRGLWIGLTDSGQEGVFGWVSGESMSYANWGEGEPANQDGLDDFAHLLWPGDPRQSRWNDMRDVASFAGIPLNGVVEVVPSPSLVTTLDFDDGIDGTAVGNFYACSGVVFSNVLWGHNSGYAGVSPGSHIISSESGGVFSDSAHALNATFAAPVTNVSITASDLGDAGARLEAYDQAEGGNLIASDEFLGSGIGIGVFHTLNVSAPGIRRIKIFQPLANGSDGVVWDSLIFSPNPAPPCLGMVLTGHVILNAPIGSTNRIEYTSSLGGTNWQTLTNVVVYQSPLEITDPHFDQAPQRFYRALRY